jgi:hypothetical protein
MNQTRQGLLLTLCVATLCLGFGLTANGESQDGLLRRYPYDPACAWGRASNGKGLLVRCLSEAESQPFRNGALATANSSAVALASNSVSNSATSPREGSTEELDAGASAPPPGDDRLEVSVGPVTADSGELGIGKLGAPKERYLKCVTDNGGLKEKTAEIYVRFLVRARGRAEGVSVSKRVNLSTEAARCVAEVVDRRYVGVPNEPQVGASVLVKFTRVAK